MQEPMRTEAEIIRNRRIELGLSQIEVAVSAGLILQQYQRFEYGYGENEMEYTSLKEVYEDSQKHTEQSGIPPVSCL